MLIRDVILLAAQLLGREDLSEEIASDAAEGEVGTLLRCYHVVENEVALDYFPLYKTERFAVTGGEVPFTQFSLAPVDIRKVTDAAGASVPFQVFPVCLSVPKAYATVEVTYSYAPEKREISEETAFMDKISERLLAFGVASEYCLVSRRYAEGKMWGERYREALRAAGILRRPLSVRSRRWV